MKYTFEYSIEGGPVTTSKSLGSAHIIMGEATWGEIRWLCDGELAVREFYRDGENYHTEIVPGHIARIVAQEVQDSLAQLDGTNTSTVALLTGMSPGELADLGGVSEDTSDVHR